MLSLQNINFKELVLLPGKIIISLYGHIRVSLHNHKVFKICPYIMYYTHKNSNISCHVATFNEDD
jgi:hypothetical protein